MHNTRIRQNVVANFASNLWIPLLGLISAPLYKNALGVEGFAFFGIFILLQAFSVPLHSGLRITLSRELARHSVGEDSSQVMADLTHTLEAVFWGLALVLTLLVIASSPLLARYWVKAEHLTQTETMHTLMVMGFALGLQWPVNLYAGGLIGLQRQVLLSTINILLYTLRYAGALPILWYVSSDLMTFFAWQAASGIVHSALLRMLLWKALPPPKRRPAFNWKHLHKLRRFMGGITGITLIGLLLTHMDKIILSNQYFLELKYFGYYSLAALAASSVRRVILPVRTALEPRFVQLGTSRNQDELSRIYHRGCQFITVMIMAPVITGAVFSRELLIVWTDDPAVVENARTVLVLLLLYAGISGLLSLPMGLMLSQGHTRVPFLTNCVLLILQPAVMLFAVLEFKAAGAAGALLAVTSLKVVIILPIVHRLFMPGEHLRWLIQDVLFPSLAITAPAVAVYLCVPDLPSRSLTGILLLAVLVAAATAGSTASKDIRRSAIDFYKTLKSTTATKNDTLKAGNE